MRWPWLAAPRDNVAVHYLQLADEQIRVWLVANCDEHAHQVDVFDRVGLRTPYAHADDAVLITKHFMKYGVPADRDLACFLLREQFVVQDLLAAEFVPSMHDGDVAGDIG